MAEPNRWRGTNMIENAYKEVEETIRRLFSPYAEGAGPGAAAPAWTPRVDVQENEAAFVVKADLPGVESKDVEITLHEGVLTIQGERSESRDEKGTDYHKVERSVGKFLRQIPLTSPVDADGVTATSSNGVISITVPKRPGAQPKKIPLT